jgi:hypothetical protein
MSHAPHRSADQSGPAQIDSGIVKENKLGQVHRHRAREAKKERTISAPTPNADEDRAEWQQQKSDG